MVVWMKMRNNGLHDIVQVRPRLPQPQLQRLSV